MGSGPTARRIGESGRTDLNGSDVGGRIPPRSDRIWTLVGGRVAGSQSVVPPRSEPGSPGRESSLSTACQDQSSALEAVAREESLEMSVQARTAGVQRP